MSGNNNDLQHTAHTIKGCAANLSANRVFDAAQQLENISRDGKMEVAAEVYNTLEKEIEKLGQALSNLDMEKAA